MPKLKPVILDMDPGVDDALAIILAVKSGLLDIRAITICGGNVSRDRCALNALKTLRMAGAIPEPPVVRGASRPLRRTPFRASGIHGADGLGEVLDKYPDPLLSELHPGNAAEVIIDIVRRQDPGNPLEIIATGPLTNIAQAISEDPETMRNVERIWWMGGAYGIFGNISPVAEFNAFCDPDAAHEVLTFGVKMTVVGLDACMQCPLSREEMADVLKNTKSPVAQFAYDITEMYMDFYRRHEGFHGCYLHDPLAVGIAIWPDIVTKNEELHVEIVTATGSTQGMTIVDRRPRNPWMNTSCIEVYEKIPKEIVGILENFDLLRPKPHVKVVLEVDREVFVKRFMSHCFL